MTKRAIIIPLRLASLFLAATVVSACSSTAYRADLQNIDVVIPEPSAISSSSAPSVEQSSSSSPKSLVVTVPFSPQAPFAVWDPLHEEACEEMSLIMLDAYWRDETLTPQIAEDRLQALITWETEQGYPEDVTAEEIARIADVYFGLRAAARTDVTQESIMEELRNGRPVIIPAAGRALGNPYFSGDGPWYHMLVITGYDHGKFITNDPGTKRGENFIYDREVLLNAIHDWTGVKEEIQNGGKAMVVIQGLK